MDLREAVIYLHETLSESSSIVGEPVGAYGFVYQPFSDFHVSALAKEGIDPQVADVIAKSLNLSQKEISDLLHLSDRSYRSHLKNNQLFTGLKAEMIVTLINLIQEGLQTFDKIENFKIWLNLELEALNYQKPADLLNTISGTRYVTEFLKTIQEGAFA